MVPKETYFHLKEEKREKIEKALEKEFARVSFEKASISNIIEDAQIPRGSFYQYFEDKEDAIRYIVQKYIMLEHKMIYEALEKTKGDIFHMAILAFEYIVKNATQKKEMNLYKNIMKEIKRNNINIFDENKEHIKIQQIKNMVDTSNLNLQNEKDLKYMMKLLISIIRTTGIEVIDNKISVEQGKLDLEEQLEILKRGMCK